MEDTNNSLRPERKRGGCLTTFLVVFMIFQVIGIISSIMTMFNKDALEEIYKTANMTASIPSTLSMVVSIVLSLVMLAGLILTIKWKKLGIYLYVGSNVVSLIVSIITAPSVATIISGIIGTIIVLGIFLLLIKNVFQYME